MTEKEIATIKGRTKSLLELVQDDKSLREKLKKSNDKQEIKDISRKLETLDEILDDICLIANEESVFDRVSREFFEIQSDTDKKLYFVYAFLRRDVTENITDYIPFQDDYFIFVPSDSKNIEYVWYWNIVDMQSTIIPVKKKEDFESKNYIITRKEIPYTSKAEYHKSRLLAYNGITADPYQEGFEKYRAHFFRILYNSSSEEEAIERTYQRYGNNRTLSRKKQL